MGVSKELFGKTKEGQDIYKYWIVNGKGMKAGIINYGAILVNLIVPDCNGNAEDIVLGYDTLEPYFENGSFFGATVGPNANRTGNASFILNGVKYQLAVNDGVNNLHSDFEKGYHKRVYDVTEGTDCVTFAITDEDGSMGFPGNKTVKVTYTLTQENALEIHYEAQSDKDTILNMTNHTYFNLAGHAAGNIEDTLLTIHASHYTPVVPGAIPTGELAPVAGTVFDFTSEKRIGQDIAKDEEQLTLVHGYDHNWVLDGTDGSVREIAVAREKNGKRTMKVYTDLPGVQFYAGNCIAPCEGKAGAKYDARSGFCLETQYYPDTANKPEFPQAVFGPSKKYDTTTIYRFC